MATKKATENIASFGASRTSSSRQRIRELLEKQKIEEEAKATKVEDETKPAYGKMLWVFR